MKQADDFHLKCTNALSKTNIHSVLFYINDVHVRLWELIIYMYIKVVMRLGIRTKVIVWDRLCVCVPD